MPPDAEPVKATARGAVPEVGLADAEAASGGALAETVIVTEELAVLLALSVTVRVEV